MVGGKHLSGAWAASWGLTLRVLPLDLPLSLGIWRWDTGQCHVGTLQGGLCSFGARLLGLLAPPCPQPTTQQLGGPWASCGVPFTHPTDSCLLNVCILPNE